MARAQSQFLRIYDNTNTTLHRWQSYYAYRPVTWQNQQWDYVPFTADGFTAGVSGDETNVTVSAPAIPTVASAFEAAILNGQYVEMLLYEFSSSTGQNTPSSSQVLIGAFNARVSGGVATATTITLQLGSALSPVGSQFPPRKLTTSLMGQGCRF